MAEEQITGGEEVFLAYRRHDLFPTTKSACLVILLKT